MNRDTARQGTITVKGSRQHGFTIIELTVALAIMVFVGYMAMLAAKMAALTLDTTITDSAQTSGTAAVSRVTDELDTEAHTALAVYVPTAGAVVDLVFYSNDDAGNPLYWGYHYDAAAKTLSRVDLTGTWPNVTVVDSHVVLDEVDSFSAQMLAANALASQSTYSAALTGVRGIRPYTMPLPGSGGIPGGNSLAILHFTTGTLSRELDLMAGSVPSTFTIVAAPSIHVVLYRQDTISRSWLGLAQKTTAHIKARVSVLYGAAGASPVPITWCDTEVHSMSGSPSDDTPARDSWQPNDPSESAESIIDNCVNHGPPMPSYQAVASASSPPPVAVTTSDTPLPGFTPPPCSTYPNSPYCVGPLPTP
jgi:prepilin-type N-terminal cleavage/methylation domain-containing protein